jgi:hypothetical protein
MLIDSYPDLHLAPDEVMVLVGDFTPGEGVELRKEFYLRGHCISREIVSLTPEALDTMMATWMMACSDGKGA